MGHGCDICFTFELIGLHRQHCYIPWAISSCQRIPRVGCSNVATHPPVDTSAISSASTATVVMIYLYILGYFASWGPIPWLYLLEIFPIRLRAYGDSMGAATQWLFNFCITKVVPTAVHNIGWRAFLMCGVFYLAIGFGVSSSSNKPKERA